MRTSLLDKNYIKSIRVMHGCTQVETAKNLGMGYLSYREKENGRVAFSDEEKIAFATCFGLGIDEFNRAFFGGRLPVR